MSRYERMSQEESVHTFFNKPENYLRRRFGVRIRAHIVQQLLGPLSGTKILDLGCGDGGVSLPLLSQNSVTFVDMSEKMLELVKGEIPVSRLGHSQIICSTVENYRPNTRFDVVLVIGLVAHIPLIPDFLIKVRELLTKQGCLILQFSDSSAWMTRLNSRRNTVRGYQLNSTRYEQFKNLLEQHGFKVKQEVRYGLLWPGMGRLPDAWLYHYSMWVLKSGLGSRWGSEVIWKVEASV